MPLVLILLMYPLHCTFITQSAYSSPSIVLASRRADGSQMIIDDFRVRFSVLCALFDVQKSISVLLFHIGIVVVGGELSMEKLRCC